jgi:hypothetical protein
MTTSQQISIALLSSNINTKIQNTSGKLSELIKAIGELEKLKSNKTIFIPKEDIKKKNTEIKELINKLTKEISEIDKLIGNVSIFNKAFNKTFEKISSSFSYLCDKLKLTKSGNQSTLKMYHLKKPKTPLNTKISIGFEPTIGAIVYRVANATITPYTASVSGPAVSGSATTSATASVSGPAVSGSATASATASVSGPAVSGSVTTSATAPDIMFGKIHLKDGTNWVVKMDDESMEIYDEKIHTIVDIVSQNYKKNKKIDDQLTILKMMINGEKDFLNQYDEKLVETKLNAKSKPIKTGGFYSNKRKTKRINNQNKRKTKRIKNRKRTRYIY